MTSSPQPDPVVLPRGEKLALVALLTAGAVTIWWASRFFDFWFDEWGIILYRRNGGFDAFFAPHNGHLLLTTNFSYWVLFQLVGLRHYWPYETLVLGAHLVATTLLFFYVRRRLPAVLAFTATAVFIVLAYAWQVLLWPEDLQLVLPVISLLGILLLRDRRSRWREPTTATLLVLALASSGLGVAVTAGVIVEKLLSRDKRREWWSVALPVALYGLWFTLLRPVVLPPGDLRSIAGADPHGDTGMLGFQHSNLTSLPINVPRAARTAAVGLFGIGPGRYGIVAVAVVAVLVMAIVVRRPPLHRFAVFAAVGGVYWMTIAATRAQFGELESIGSSRYLYAGSLCVLLMLVSVFTGVRPPVWATVAVVVVALLVLRADVLVLRDFRDVLRVAFGQLHAQEAQVVAGRSSVDPNLVIGSALAPDVRAATFLTAVDDLGAPSPSDEGDSRHRAEVVFVAIAASAATGVAANRHRRKVRRPSEHVKR